MKSYFKRISACVCMVIMLLSLQIPHAFAAEADYLARLHSETSSDVLGSKYGDFDGDSSFEMVALTGSGNKDDGYDGDVYFLTQDRIIKIVSNAHFWGTDAVEVFEICGVNFIAVKTVPGNYPDTKVFALVNGECVLTNISDISHNLKTKFDDNTLAVLETDFDGMFDGRDFLSRTEKDYFFYWDSEAGEFKEYGGIKITPEQLATLDGASEILELIRNSGYKLGDIFFRKNGIINCNYTYTDEGDTSGVYYCGNANMMYDGVSCKLLEVNDWDDTALQRSSYGGIYEAALSDNAVYPESFPETIYDNPAPTVTVTASEIEADLIIKPSTDKIKYGYTLELFADLSLLPEGTRLEWNLRGDGFEMTVSDGGDICRLKSVGKGSARVIAKVVDSDGNILTDADGKELIASQKLTSKAGIFRKVAAFFKNLFKSDMTVR